MNKEQIMDYIEEHFEELEEEFTKLLMQGKVEAEDFYTWREEQAINADAIRNDQLLDEYKERWAK